MSCVEFEHRVALYVECDLPQCEERLVAAHLESCAGCREFAAEMRDSQTALKQLRMDLVEESTLQEVRAEVLNRLSIPRKTAAWPRYAIAAMLVAGLWAGWLWRARTAAPLEVQPRALVMAPPVVEAPAPRPRVRPTPVARHRVRRSPAFKSEPLVVKIVTDDPQVVIYWLVSQNGG
jgi:anti-sigma factor RsiW